MAHSLSVSCEAGGPYSSGSKVIIVGNVIGENSNVSSVRIDINKSGIPRLSTITTSDSSGVYFVVFDQSFDLGNYEVLVTANNTTHIANCYDEFEVVVGEVSKECQQVSISVQGRAYAGDKLLTSGKVFVGIDGLKETNTTNFSNGYFQISLSACVHLGNKYLLQIHVTGSEGEKGSVYIQFIPT